MMQAKMLPRILLHVRGGQPEGNSLEGEFSIHNRIQAYPRPSVNLQRAGKTSWGIGFLQPFDKAI